ncbi:MAG TPA: M20/M25/M40 family metallo-hydrolase [Blastocatellia bacterium]|nr:M20/M25/M40 family metallo-hydrolase [Blastocatellia bacterium]
MKNHTRLFLTTLLLVSLVSSAISARQRAADPIEQQAARIAGSILVNGRSMDYLRGLTDQFGGRLTGTAAYQRSAEWCAEQFRAAGIKNVKLEPFTIPNGWDRGSARGRMTSPMDRPVHIQSLGWSPSTPPEGVKAEVILFSELAPEKIRAQTGKLKGRAVMLDLAAVFADGFGAFAKLIAALPILREVGASAIIVTDNERNNVLNAFGFTWGAQLSTLPLAQIGMEDGKLIERLLAKGPVTLEFAFENRTSGPTEVNNVIAEIPGHEKPDEWIIIGGHLDSWDYGTGAQDNGTGCAMVLEAARAIAAMAAPRRSIRFALWGGEEEGLLGSAAYVKAHKAELEKCVAALNTDNGAGHPKGWKVQGRADLNDSMKTISALLAGISGDGLSQQTSFDTDHGHFMLEGIPALDLWVDMTHYGEVHHKSSDTIDKVDVHNLTAGSAILAITGYAISERSEPVAPHIDHTAVGDILKKAKLDAFLKAIGIWN